MKFKVYPDGSHSIVEDNNNSTVGIINAESDDYYIINIPDKLDSEEAIENYILNNTLSFQANK